MSHRVAASQHNGWDSEEENQMPMKPPHKRAHIDDYEEQFQPMIMSRIASNKRNVPMVAAHPSCRPGGKGGFQAAPDFGLPLPTASQEWPGHCVYEDNPFQTGPPAMHMASLQDGVSSQQSGLAPLEQPEPLPMLCQSPACEEHNQPHETMMQLPICR